MLDDVTGTGEEEVYSYDTRPSYLDAAVLCSLGSSSLSADFTNSERFTVTEGVLGAPALAPVSTAPGDSTLGVSARVDVHGELVFAVFVFEVVDA